MVLDDNLAIALQGNIGKAALPTCPAGSGAHLLQVNLLVMVIAGKDIIEPQRAVHKVFVKLLCACRKAKQGYRK